MFDNDDTVSVQMWLEVTPSISTPMATLNQLSFRPAPPVERSFIECYAVDTAEYFFGNDWHDHLEVLFDLIQGDIEVLKRLVFLDTNITIKLWWTGKPGAPPPQLTPDNLSHFWFPGLKFISNIGWDYGNHKGDLVEVSFCVYGPEPDQVSRLLVNPSQSVRVGDPITSKGTVVNHRKINAWILETDDFCQSSDVFEHLESLYTRIGPPTSQWRSFIETTSAEVQVRIVWYASSGQTEPVFSHDTLRKIGSYGAQLHISTADYLPNTK